MSHYPESGEHVMVSLKGQPERDAVIIGNDSGIYVVRFLDGMDGCYHPVKPEDIRAITSEETAVSLMMQAAVIVNPALKSSKIARDTCLALYTAGCRLLPCGGR